MPKVIIERNTERKVNGGEVVWYQVKYKRRWYSPWRYAMRHYTHSDSEILQLVSLTTAIEEAQKLHENLGGTIVTKQDLNMNGYPVHVYSGG